MHRKIIPRVPNAADADLAGSFFFRLAAGDVRTFGNMNSTGRSEIRTLPPPPLSTFLNSILEVVFPGIDASLSSWMSESMGLQGTSADQRVSERRIRKAAAHLDFSGRIHGNSVRRGRVRV